MIIEGDGGEEAEANPKGGS